MIDTFLSTFAATIMDIAYDARIEDSFTDLHVLKIEVALEGLTEAGVPGAFLVDIMPILKYVPAWFPGAGFKRKAAIWSKNNTDVVQDPFIRVEENLVCLTRLNLRYIFVDVTALTERRKGDALYGHFFN